MSQFITGNKIKKIFSNIPQLETKRLILRKILPSDSSDVYDYSSRKEVPEFLLWYPHPNIEYSERYTEQLQEQYRAGDFYDWGVVLKSNEKMIGTCGFTSFDIQNNRGEIGYVLNPDYCGSGYATEAVNEVMSFGFNKLNLNRIEAKYMIGNDRSRKLMERCGMKFEGVLRGYILTKGEYKDIGICSITADEYYAKYGHNGGIFGFAKKLFS